MNNEVKRDSSMEQTAAGLSNIHGIETSFSYTEQEKNVLRELAIKVRELSERDIEDEKRKLWTDHNSLKECRPIIFCDPENGWNEIITQDQILCKDQLLRVWEMYLRKEIFWGDKIKDDKVIERKFYVPYYYSDSGYGLNEIKEQTSSDGAFHYISPINNYSEQFEQLTYPQITIDYAKSEKVLNLAKEIFGDILDIEQRGLWWWSLGMTWDYIKLRGLENFMMDMILEPEWVHKMMQFLSQSIHKKLNFLENEGLLSANNNGTYVGSGGFGWSDELKSSAQHAKTIDMWGFCESQESVGVSPDMFGEFIFPYQKGIMERFGLNCYGCCEPIDPRWKYVSQIPRLRRVSVSPWANIPLMSEQLENNYIMSIKPSPTPLASSIINEDEVRKDLNHIVKSSKGRVVEIIMKDNHTLGNNPDNIIRWCEIAKELTR